MALPFLLRVSAPSEARAAGFRSLFAFWAGGGAASEVVVPPVVDAGGGGFYPYRQDRLPVIEGVGYGVLPQVEGEAHGLVLGVGAGVANLPRLASAGAGTVAVAADITARLAIKAGGIGDLGQAGSGAGIVGIKAAAIGRHDDDEAVMIALLLAA